jgi:hypothetical protein
MVDNFVYLLGTIFEIILLMLNVTPRGKFNFKIKIVLVLSSNHVELGS